MNRSSAGGALPAVRQPDEGEKNPMRKAHLTLILAAMLAGCNLPMSVQTPTLTRPAATQAASPTAPTAAETEEATVESPATQAPASPTPAAPTPTPEATAAEATLAASPTPPAPEASPTPEAPPLPEEAILILEPGPGSRLVSPVRVSGIANPAFEQTLGVAIVLDDGTQLALGPASIEAEPGQRGSFTVDAPFEVEGERQAFIQVFDISPRDGGILHLASVGVTLLEEGEASVTPVEPHPERIALFEPQAGATVSGGTAQVEGFALASFEQTLLVEVQDASGNVIGAQSALVEAPDLGIPGPFRAEVPYELDSAGPGRIVVRDLSAAFGGDVHVSSVEVELEP